MFDSRMPVELGGEVNKEAEKTTNVIDIDTHAKPQVYTLEVVEIKRELENRRRNKRSKVSRFLEEIVDIALHYGPFVFIGWSLGTAYSRYITPNLY